MRWRDGRRPSGRAEQGRSEQAKSSVRSVYSMSVAILSGRTNRKRLPTGICTSSLVTGFIEGVEKLEYARRRPDGYRLPDRRVGGFGVCPVGAEGEKREQESGRTASVAHLISVI